jgi:hypothetical protein
MRKTLYVVTLIILLVVPAPTICQENSPQLPLLQDVVKMSSLDGSVFWLGTAMSGFLGSRAPTSENRLKSEQEVIADIDLFLQRSPKGEPERLQQQLISKHSAVIRAVFERLNSKNFVYAYLPIRFALKDGQLTLVLTGLASDNVYNTLNSTSRSRASQVLSGSVLPALKQLEPALSIDGLKFCSVSATYGSKNFADRTELSLRGEAVTAVLSVDQVRKYAAGELADDDVVATADIYLVDRDDPGVKKVRLTLQ